MSTTLERTEAGPQVVCDRCMFCGQREVLLLTESELIMYAAWKAGVHVQNSFICWPKERRELLLTGTHAACWDSMFAGEEL